jgi:hypothetical protein
MLMVGLTRPSEFIPDSSKIIWKESSLSEFSVSVISRCLARVNVYLNESNDIRLNIPDGQVAWPMSSEVIPIAAAFNLHVFLFV